MIYRFSRFEVASIKRTILSLKPLKRRKETLQKQAKLIIEELEALNTQIDAYTALMQPITKGIDPAIILASPNYEVTLSEACNIPNDENIGMDEVGPEQEDTKEECLVSPAICVNNSHNA